MLTSSARVLGAEQGDVGQLGSIGVRFMVDSADSGGMFSLVEHPIPPRKLAAPLHRHSREDEYTFVLEGEVGVLLGDEVVFAGAAHSSSSHADNGTPSGMPASSPLGCWRSSRRVGSRVTSNNSATCCQRDRLPTRRRSQSSPNDSGSNSIPRASLA